MKERHFLHRDNFSIVPLLCKDLHKGQAEHKEEGRVPL